jgi:hypothetical protein
MPLGSWCSGNTLVRCREVGTHVGSSSSVPSTRVYRSPWFDPEASCSVFALPVVFLDQVKRLVRYESIAKDSGDLIVWCLCFFVNLYWSWFCVSWCRFLSERRRKSRLDFWANRVTRAYSGAEWPKTPLQDFPKRRRPNMGGPEAVYHPSAAYQNAPRFGNPDPRAHQNWEGPHPRPPLFDNTTITHCP